MITLKALADPVRLAILSVLMDRTRATMRVMSVKELAAELGEPQTKLYRHVRLLEAAGLIRVAATRQVSGITEQRYEACQQDLAFGPELLRGGPAAESEPVITALLDRYREQFFAAQRAGLIADGAGMLTMAETRVPPGRAASVARRLQEIMDELQADALAPDAGAGQDGVAVNMLIGFYALPGDASA